MTEPLYGAQFPSQGIFTFTGAIIMSFQYDNLFSSGSHKLAGFQALFVATLMQVWVFIY